MAEDLRILAIGALDTGVTTIKRSGCTQQTARVVQQQLLVLLNHELFAGSKLHPVLQAALILSLDRLKEEIVENYGWPGLNQHYSDQLLGIINTDDIHPAVMHAAVTALKSLAPYAMPAEAADRMLEAICCWALTGSKATDRLSALLLSHSQDHYHQSTLAVLASAPRLLPCLTQSIQQAESDSAQGYQHIAQLLVLAIKELAGDIDPQPEGVASLVQAATKVLVDTALAADGRGDSLEALSQLLACSDEEAGLLHARLLAATSVQQVSRREEPCIALVKH